MPDYKILGRALLRVAHGERIDDSLDVFYAQDVEMHIDVAALLHDSGAFSTVDIPLPDLDDDPFFIATRASPPFRPSSPPNGSRPTSVASTARTNSRPGTALARPKSQASTHSRTASIPTPDPIATRTRVRLGGTSAMNTSSSAAPAKGQGQGLQDTDPVRSATHPTLTADPSKTTASRTVPAPTVARRIQPPRAASSRSIGSGPSVQPTTRTAGTATSKARPTTTRGTTTRPATTGDKDVKGTKPITSQSVASKPSSQPRAAGPSTSGVAARPGPSSGNSDLVIDIIPVESEGADAEYFFEV
ncbi:hypothetical protein PHLGIDRAFT_470870 [Phlebiopsis gigantea 11061_1 CR5-6]|uniref:Uncharacterized protein n=1 Tax=Phlebiopsis gigantea (strain 11061_1 CR5-6) TaxID=745531 RepID=A0A0C3NM35_PHLG1|nr:hypothetical protein PHLGIDRAFT_470870 [Phlebiopsis gigantea 11061_1 CR5-6]